MPHLFRSRSRKPPASTCGNPLRDDAGVAGLDLSGGRYATVCDTYGTICSHSTLRLTPGHLPHAEWCEACHILAGRQGVSAQDASAS